MKRGDIILVSLPGDYGKLRPALVVQSDAYRKLHSVTVLPLASDILDANETRITIEASSRSGLRKPSQVMVDKASTIPRIKAGAVIGQIGNDDMAAVERALASFFELA